MAIVSQHCKATSSSTGKPCRQPAIKGTDFCRFHQPDSSGVKSKSKVETPSRKPGKPGNANARKHGAYSSRLLPEEIPLYEEKREAFTAALGEVDVFDEQIVHLLALISVKADASMMQGAEHAAYGGMIKQILDLMKELKATRASKDPVEAGRNLTYADLYAQLKAHFESESPAGRGGVGTVLREKHMCARCRQQSEHERTPTGEIKCRNCGALRKEDSLFQESDDRDDTRTRL
jgi:hypothetical protein